VHGVFTQLAYVLAGPQATPLPDLGFSILPALPESADWASEALFYTLFFGGILFTLSPLVCRCSRFTAVGGLAAGLPALVLCQALRIACFHSTRLPSPAAHCLAGAEAPVHPRPDRWYGYVLINVVTQAAKSCGDLIFSSHMIFVLSFGCMYAAWGRWLAVKAAWLAASVALSLLIIASRKHYSVDIVVAWIVVPLVFHAFAQTARWKRLTARPDGGRGAATVSLAAVVVAPDPAPTERKDGEREERAAAAAA
jgi:hypothetical protein